MPLVFVMALWALPTRADTAPEVPPEVRAAVPGAVQIGAARLRVWGLAIYDARLWAAPGFEVARYARQPFALELRYLREFSREDIARRSVDEMRRGTTIDEAQSQRWQHAMRAAFPDVRAGDTITGLFSPAAGNAPAAASFVTNGRPTGDIRDGDFAVSFFGIWLSSRTSEPAMRQALTSGGTLPP